MADTLKKDIYAEKRIVKALGHYNSKETAQQILELLLDALQDGEDTFYMPPP